MFCDMCGVSVIQYVVINIVFFFQTANCVHNSKLCLSLKTFLLLIAVYITVYLYINAVY